jgi:hypothetical protein
MKHLLILTLLLLFSMNCHHARVRLDNESGGTKGEVKTLQHKFWLGGFFPRKVEVDATQICPSGVYEIDQLLYMERCCFNSINSWYLCSKNFKDYLQLTKRRFL